MSIESLQDLYLDQLRDMYNAEQQIAKALPKIIEAASRPQLRSALEHHLQQTRTHAERLERIFERLEESPKGKKCRGMEGILKEAAEFLDEDPPEDVCDAGIVCYAQHIEHYEVASYGTLREYARQLNQAEAAHVLEQTLREEEETDRTLTAVAESGINQAARDSSEELSAGL